MSLILNLLIATQAMAATPDSGDISCKTEANPPKNALQVEYTLKGYIVWHSDSDTEASLSRVTMTTRDLDSKDIEIGRAKQIHGAVSPRARKYKEHYSFNMSKLIEVTDFGRYTPLDSCMIHVKLPNNLFAKSRFDAPVVTNCDQNGGSQTMECTFKPDLRD